MSAVSPIKIKIPCAHGQILAALAEKSSRYFYNLKRKTRSFFAITNIERAPDQLKVIIDWSCVVGVRCLDESLCITKLTNEVQAHNKKGCI